MQHEPAPAGEFAGEDGQQQADNATSQTTTSEGLPGAPGGGSIAEGAPLAVGLSPVRPAEGIERRNALVDALKERGLLHNEVLERAMRRVPREYFVPEIAQREGLERVYADDALITRRSSQGQALSSSSAPSMMAIMLEQLDLHPGLRVLEIGAGTGYNAALLAEVVGDQRAITTLDLEPDIVEQARQHLLDAGYPEIRVLCADGIEGAPDLAPFDRIELTVASDDIAPAWISQLSDDGRLVLPLEIHRYQRGQISLAFIKREHHLESVAAAMAFFIPLRGEAAMSAERSAPLSVVSRQDKDHRWELTVYGAPISTSAAIRREVLHLLSGSYETRDLHLDGSARALLSYLELRYGEQETLYAWSGNAIWGFEGWSAGIYRQGGLALVRAATPTPDDAGLDRVVLYGSGAALRQLHQRVREWKRLHQPDLEALSVRAYPQGQAPAPAPDEWLVTKRSVDLLLSFLQDNAES